MADVWFYHLDREPVEDVLPGLLARGLQRGLRMAVQSPSVDRLKLLSERLWAYEDVAFLAHGDDTTPMPEAQPIFLTASDANPNASAYRFFIDGAEPANVGNLARDSIMFDGNDPAVVEQARALWKRCKAEGHAISYWKQDEERRWKNQAAS